MPACGANRALPASLAHNMYIAFLWCTWCASVVLINSRPPTCRRAGGGIRSGLPLASSRQQRRHPSFTAHSYI